MSSKSSKKKAEFRENITFEIEKQILWALAMLVCEKNFQYLNDVHWKTVALKINEDGTRGTLFNWKNLRHHFISSLVYRCSEKKYGLKESAINKLIYPYLRKIYSVTLKFIRGNRSKSSNNTIQLEFQKLLIKYTMSGKYDEQIVEMFKKINPMRKRLTIEIDVDDPYFNLLECKEILLQMDDREQEKKTKRLIKNNNRLKLTAVAESNQEDHIIVPDLQPASECNEFIADQFDDLTIGTEEGFKNIIMPPFNHNAKDLKLAESSETPIESNSLIISNNVEGSAIAHPVTNDNNANEPVTKQEVAIADTCFSESFFLDENTESTDSEITEVETIICKDLSIAVDVQPDDDKISIKKKANHNLLRFLENYIQEKAKKPAAKILHQPEKEQFSEKSKRQMKSDVVEKSVVAEPVHRTSSHNLIALDNCSSAIIITSDDDSEKNFFNPSLRVRRRPNPDMVPKLPKRKKIKFRQHNHLQIEISKNGLPANMYVNVMSKCQAYVEDVVRFQQESQLSSSPASNLEDKPED